MISPLEFLRATKSQANNEEDFRLGTIPGTYAGGRPTIIFDGESVESGKTYTYLGSYAPAANDRVLLARVGHTWVVLGEVI